MNPADRLLAAAGFRLHHSFARTLRASPALAAAVERHAARLRTADPAAELPALRYRLRRDGLRRELLAECFALYGACQGTLPSRAVLAAALGVARGAIVELADPAERRAALTLAAFARALHGERVHLLAPLESSAKALYELAREPFSALGVSLGCVERGSPLGARREAYAGTVVCGAHREVAQDYLRERLEAGPKRGRLSGPLERLASGASRLMPAVLGCALVEDADIAMLDDAQAPVAIAAEVDQSAERLLYEQALELARGLAEGRDFVLEEEGIRLTEAAAGLLERLVVPLGGVWGSRQRREALTGLALEALHLFQRDVDYRVQAGQVLFPPRPVQGDSVPGPDEEIQKLVEVKEGCRLSARREVVGRLSLPRFFLRYRALGGVCADARSLEAEFWKFYSLKTSCAGARPPRARLAYRVFASAEDKRAALAREARAALAAGTPVLIAARRQAELQALQPLLQEARPAFALMPAGEASAPGGRVLIAELPDAARHAARLLRESGAAACEVLLSLDEEAVRVHLGAASGVAVRLALRGPELAPALAAWLGRRLQRAAERGARTTRQELKARDQALDDLLAFSGQSN